MIGCCNPKHAGNHSHGPLLTLDGSCPLVTHEELCSPQWQGLYEGGHYSGIPDTV